LSSASEEEFGDGVGEVVAGAVDVGGARDCGDHRCLAWTDLRMMRRVWSMRSLLSRRYTNPREMMSGDFVETACAAIYRRDDDAEAFLAERFAVAHQYIGEFGHGLAFDDAKL
jgi:hypothetical protein